MSFNTVRNHIASLLQILTTNEIAIETRPVVIRNLVLPNHGGQQGTRVTWANPTGQGIPPDLFTNTSDSTQNYLDWIASQHYSAILVDGSILQLTYDFDGEELIAHRLMYHPCPYDVDEKSLREDPILQVLYDYIGKEENVRLRSPIRFDFDKRAASLGHPATHLTLLTPHCRWPVSAPLSVGHFVRFLFKHFYSEYWLAHQTLRTFPQNNHQITITDEETRFLHIACAR